MSLVKYCFGYEDNITIDDLGSLNPVIYRLALNINNSFENVDLSLINGFNEWAENNGIQVNKNYIFFDFFLKKFLLIFYIYFISIINILHFQVI